jgi:hypothetical protein
MKDPRQETLNRIADALERIATALELTAGEKPAPNYREDIKNYPKFDWTSIGAEVLKADRYGAGLVRWRGKNYTRRSPQNNFGTTVFFSRCTGKDETGRNVYERLITFSPVEEVKIRPISREAESSIGY